MLIIDWGTSSLRAYEIDKNYNLKNKTETQIGITSVKKDAWPQILSDSIEIFEEKDAIVMSGMVGSRDGWKPTPYVDAPLRAKDVLTRAQSFNWNYRHHKNVSIWVIPGVQMRKKDDTIEIMRGEETQILGLLQAEPDFCGEIILPGTHSKWVTLQRGLITNISTYMTGELFRAAQQHTILTQTTTNSAKLDQESFLTGVKAGSSNSSPFNLMFQARSKVLEKHWSQDQASNYLSGLLIGHEIKANSHKTSEIRLIGSSNLVDRYELAFNEHKIEPKTYNSSIVIDCAPLFMNLVENEKKPV